MVSDTHLDDQQLLAVVLGSATPATRAHVHDCAPCRHEVAAWSTIRSGAVVANSGYEAPVPDRVLRGALERIAAEPLSLPVLDVPVRRRVRWGWRLLCRQIPLVRRSIAAATALMLLLGAAVVLSRSAGHGAALLSLLAPPAAAVGLALIYGPEIDPSMELAGTTGTSPRTVLLARLVLVCTYDFGLAVAATALAVAFGEEQGGFAALVGAWFGPMLLLSALSLVLAVLIRPGVGVAVALALWALRLMAGFGSLQGLALLSARQAQTVRSAWATSPLILILAAVLLVVAVAAAPRRLRLTS